MCPTRTLDVLPRSILSSASAHQGKGLQKLLHACMAMVSGLLQLLRALVTARTKLSDFKRLGARSLADVKLRPSSFNRERVRGWACARLRGFRLYGLGFRV